MEAWRFGFNLPPANKFDPTDADIVAHYLLPRAVGYPNPYAHAIIDADPCSCPPWELLRRHGHGESDHAFFFAPPRVPDPKKRAYRAVASGEDDGVGGTWDGQRSDAIRLVLLRGGDGDGARPLEITFRRANLSYYHGQQKKKTSGWVMHEYQIVDPPHLSATVLSRVKITREGKKKKKQEKEKDKQQQAAAVSAAGAGRQVAPPGPDQPGPSNYYDQPTGGGVMGDTGGCYGSSGGGGCGNYMYEGYGSGSGNCFATGDDGGRYDANGGGAMGETGGYYGDGGNGYLNQDPGCYLGHGDGGGYCFDVGAGNNYDYKYHDCGNGGQKEEEQC
ncbi:unnamed protein product [Urochloa decumbens]|uniref:NAC domain-containing protein n=1 Tax=Urochloa decumbens TaxID=240449 RepID=A0ABC9AUV2_9POAL